MSLYDEFLRRAPDLMRCLENARAAGRFATSFLVASQNEKIRCDFTRVLMQLAGCRSVSPDGRPDIGCDFCRRVEAGNYADCHRVTPVGKMFQIKVGDRINPEPNTLRDLLDHLGYTAMGHRKFGIIEDADRMGDEAQNALLKTLEEPPPETTIILTTANPSSLLPTTRSRCQLLSLPEPFVYTPFPGYDETRRALFALCFNCCGDPTATEQAASTLIDVAQKLSDLADEESRNEFSGMISSAKQSEDAAYIKRVEQRRLDSSYGSYMRERGRFLSVISGFCSQLYMLSRGVAFETLPDPELFDGLTLAPVSEKRGAAILKEAEELKYTLLFNVSDELALRTFAVNLAMG